MSENTVEVRVRTKDMSLAMPLVRVPFTREGIERVGTLVRAWGVQDARNGDLLAGHGYGRFVIGENCVYYEWVVKC